jgi:hypothetical protein
MRPIPILHQKNVRAERKGITSPSKVEMILTETSKLTVPVFEDEQGLKTHNGIGSTEKTRVFSSNDKLKQTKILPEGKDHFPKDQKEPPLWVPGKN